MDSSIHILPSNVNNKQDFLLVDVMLYTCDKRMFSKLSIIIWQSFSVKQDIGRSEGKQGNDLKLCLSYCWLLIVSFSCFDNSMTIVSPFYALISPILWCELEKKLSPLSTCLFVVSLCLSFIAYSTHYLVDSSWVGSSVMCI